jgi:hypothetical protein
VAFFLWETIVWLSTGTIFYITFKVTGLDGIALIKMLPLDGFIDVESINPNIGLFLYSLFLTTQLVNFFNINFI